MREGEDFHLPGVTASCLSSQIYRSRYVTKICRAKLTYASRAESGRMAGSRGFPGLHRSETDSSPGA